MERKHHRDEAVIEFMRRRRSVPARNIVEPGPTDEEIQTMIEIASRVPDHGKLAPWRFVRFTENRRSQLGDRFAQRAKQLNPQITGDALELERQRFNSPVVIGVYSAPIDHPKIPQWEQILSCGAAAMNLLIAANAHGWDAQWLTEWMAFDDDLRPDLDVEPGERIAGFIHIGTASMPKTERDRPELSNIFSVVGD